MLPVLLLPRKAIHTNELRLDRPVRQNDHRQRMPMAGHWGRRFGWMDDQPDFFATSIASSRFASA
jgi:hypothetical protein